MTIKIKGNSLRSFEPSLADEIVADEMAEQLPRGFVIVFNSDLNYLLDTYSRSSKYQEFEIIEE